MSDGVISVSPSTSTSAKDVDNSVVGSSGYRQRVVLGGDSSSGQLVVVAATTPASSDYGLVTRVVSMPPITGSVSLLTSPLDVQQVSGNPWGVYPTSGGLSVSTGNRYWPVRLTDGSSFYTAGGGGSASTLVSLSSGTSLVGTVDVSSGTRFLGIVAISSGTVSLSSGLGASTAQIGSLGPSSGNVVGLVGLSSAVTLSSGTLTLGTLTTGTVVGLTTTSVVGLSSALTNYVTNSTSVPVYQSSGNVVGLVAPSSNWSMALLGSSGFVVGQVAQSSGFAFTSTSVALAPSSGNVIGLVGLSSAVTLSSGVLTLGTLTTGTVVGLTTTSVVGLSSAVTNYVTNSTTVPVYLGQSSGVVVGLVGLSSAVTLSSGGLTIGTLTTGTVVGLTTTSIVGLTTTSLVGFSTTANIVSGVVSNAANPAAISSGGVAPYMVDQMGKSVVAMYGPRGLIGSTFSAVTANTSMTQVVSAAGAGLMRDIIALEIFSTAGTTALAKTTVMLFSSSGQAEPGVWMTQILLGPTIPTYRIDFNTPLPQLTANNPWFIVSTSSAAPVRAVAQYVTTTT
jgi:hypothetical protein